MRGSPPGHAGCCRFVRMREAGPADRRASQRARVEVQVEVSHSSEPQFFVGLTGDISEGGLFVATWRRFSVDAPVALALSLPDGPLLARGHVCWVRDGVEGGATPGLGIAFELLSPGDRARIRGLLRRARAPLRRRRRVSHDQGGHLPASFAWHEGGPPCFEQQKPVHVAHIAQSTAQLFPKHGTLLAQHAPGKGGQPGQLTLVQISGASSCPPSVAESASSPSSASTDESTPVTPVSTEPSTT